MFGCTRTEDYVDNNTVRLLLIEDSDDDASLLTMHLHGAPFEVSICHVNSESAYQEQLQQPWDIILCDYNIPSFSVAKALKTLHAIANPIPFIIISGALSSHIAAELMLKGASDFIDKTDLSRLIPAIQRELHVSQLRQEKRDIEKRLSNISNFDELTSLPNQNHFLNKLQTIIHGNSQQQYIIGHLSFERLSMILDIHGEHIFQQILRELTTRLYQVSNCHTCIARLGQHEFALLIPCDSGCHLCENASRAILEQFEDPFTINHQELFINPIIGMSCYPCHEVSAEKLLRNARYAMQYAYEKQKTWQHFTPEIEQEKIEHVQISDRLRGAIQRDELSLHYQPKIHGQQGYVTAVEVLLRWHDQQLGHISPARFIPIAESSGDIIAIGEWVLHKACQQAQVWRKQGVFYGKIAVNLSMRQLRDIRFPQRVQSILRETSFPAEMLELEITETEIMKDSETSIKILQQLNNMGISLAIDDFGTGHSSLSYLKRLPICCLKIDRAFVTDIENSNDSLSIVRAILALARSLRLETVAEGVENTSQQRLLEQEGCDELQGYLFSRPLPAKEIQQFLLSHQLKFQTG